MKHATHGLKRLALSAVIGGVLAMVDSPVSRALVAHYRFNDNLNDETANPDDAHPGAGINFLLSNTFAELGIRFHRKLVLVPPHKRAKLPGAAFSIFIFCGLFLFGFYASAISAAPALSPPLTKPRPITLAELVQKQTKGVTVVEVSDYVFGNYKGDFPSPPQADFNPKKAYIIFWRDYPFRFVFSHEASYCPWFELPSGGAVSYQFLEGNDGWAELFNQWGRMERNSYIEVIESGPKRVWVRWTYFGVNIVAGQPAYRATEDFWAYPNGLIVRRQTYESLIPLEHKGYTREPIELIGLCSVGQLWYNVLRQNGEPGERHALAVLDAFSDRRYDVYWKPKPGTLWDATHRRTGCTWPAMDDAAGVALVLPLVDGAPFCIFGDASGYRHDYTRLKEHTFPGEGNGWGSSCWDHWPIGWLNSQGHGVDAASLQRYPNHFSPAGMDFFALPNEESARGIYYSLLGVAGENLEAVRQVARRWLEKGESAMANPDSGADLAATWTGVITRPPDDVTVGANQTAAFNVAVFGFQSPSFQWQQANPGTTNFADIAGAQGTSYLAGPVSAADNGVQYRCVVQFPGGSMASRAATLRVDMVAPAVICARTLGDPNKVTVVFSEPIASGVVAANFAIDNGITVNSVTPGLQVNTLELAVSPITLGKNYLLTVNNIRDLVGNVIKPNSRIAVDLFVELPMDYGQTVNGFQEDFNSPRRDPNWVAVPPDRDRYEQTNGVLTVTVNAGDPNHLIYLAPGYDTATQEVLARIRILSFSGDPYARAGVAVAVNPDTSAGINLSFRGYPSRQFKLLDDQRAWHPPDPLSGLEIEFHNQTWYWLRLRLDQDDRADGAHIHAKVWRADGSVPEPVDWPLHWSRDRRTGYAGIQGSSGGGQAQFELDYILIKAKGLPKIKVQPSAFVLLGPR